MSEFERVTKMEGVAEYAEQLGVELVERQYTDAKKTNLVIVRAMNEGGHNCTEVDLIDLILWLKENRPELLD